MLQISQIEFQMFWIVVHFQNCAYLKKMPSSDKLEAIWKPFLQDMLRENPAAPCLFRIDNQIELPLMGLSGWWWSTWKYSELEIKPNHLWVASLWSWRTSPPHTKTQMHRWWPQVRLFRIKIWFCAIWSDSHIGKRLSFTQMMMKRS